MDQRTYTGTSLAERWRQAVVDDLAEAAAIVGEAGLPLPRRIKLVRSRLKRSQALLRLAPAGLDAAVEAVRERVRGVRRLLGGARDAQARREALDDVLRDVTDREGPAEAMRFAACRARLAAAEREALEALKPDDVAGTAAMLAEAGAMLADLPTVSVADTAIIERFRAEYRRARRRRPRPGGRFDAERLHLFRDAAIAQLYQADLVAPDQSRHDSLARIRRLLGKVQDLDMLRQALAADAGLATPGEAERLSRLARRGQKRRAATATDLAKRLFGQPTRRFWPKAALPPA